FFVPFFLGLPALRSTVLQLGSTTLWSFSVVVPETPVSGLFGGSVTLPCALSDNLDARKLEVRWYRPSMYSSPALLYLNEKLDLTSADLKYQGRVSLPGPLEKGEASLKLDDLRSSDIGTYMCHVSSKVEHINANIILSFLAVGSSPILSMLDAGGGKVNVSCRSHGWLPKPTLTWRDREGSSLNPPNETHTSTKGSPALRLLLRLSLCYHNNEKSTERKRHVLILLTNHVCVVETPKFFRTSHGGKDVRYIQPKEKHEEYHSKIFTLCKEKFSSGQQYWELKVNDKSNQKKISWYVGVAAEEAERINGIRFTPERGFWVLCCEKEKGVYIRESSAPTPLSHISDDLSVVGVFLDCDNHTLSFYNTETQSLIYTYTSVTFKTSLRPLISPGIRDTHPQLILLDVVGPSWWYLTDITLDTVALDASQRLAVLVTDAPARRAPTICPLLNSGMSPIMLCAL
uniref:Ig-like domain-containing protein n=1 Tax=Astyanax mexicanus TaxID=7994 RepID=A0A8B9LWD1_ASTMX